VADARRLAGIAIMEDVAASAAGQQVAARAAEDPVVAAASGDDVVARSAIDLERSVMLVRTVEEDVGADLEAEDRHRLPDTHQGIVGGEVEVIGASRRAGEQHHHLDSADIPAAALEGRAERAVAA